MVSRAVAHSALILALTVAVAGCAGPSSSLERGLQLYAEGRYLEAQDEFEKAIRRQPDSAVAHLDRGAARVRIGDVTGALADYTRALELSPLDPDIYYNRGNAYVFFGRWDDAVADYTKAIALRPDHSSAYFNRGTVHARLGDVAGARTDWAYAAAIEPDPQIRTAMIASVSSDLAVAAAAPAVTVEAPMASPRLESPEAVAVSPREALAPADPVALNARALATRGVARQLDGDREGARGDLEAALALETDAGRRAVIAQLLRALD
ncbi:MAG TPA: tetratricopeptide repeat protein, partial [Solirubrobacteraceae bacterium]